jgi:hypothetical protein
MANAMPPCTGLVTVYQPWNTGAPCMSSCGHAQTSVGRLPLALRHFPADSQEQPREQGIAAVINSAANAELSTRSSGASVKLLGKTPRNLPFL